MGRAPCCDKENVKRGPWSPEEDAKLKSFIDKNGTGGNWIALPHKAGLKRCGKSCRLRWLNYLRPNIKHGEFTDDEDKIICSLYASIGSRWSIIAAQLPGRTDNDIKNYWNTKLKKKLLAMLPSFQKKSSLFPSTSLQSPSPYRSNQFMTNNSSPFYGYTTTPNFMNMNNNMISSLPRPTSTTTCVQDHITHLSPPPPLDPNSLISLMTSNVDNNESCFYLGFQEDNQSMYNNTSIEYNYPTSDLKEAMFMFGSGGDVHEVSNTGSSSEGGSSLSQMSHGNYNRDQYHKQQQHQIKQEEFTLQGFGDHSQGFIINHDYTDQKPKVYNLKNYETMHSDLEEVKQLIGNTNSSSSSSYLFNDDDDYKTTHDHREICYHY